MRHFILLSIKSDFSVWNKKIGNWGSFYETRGVSISICKYSGSISRAFELGLENLSELEVPASYIDGIVQPAGWGYLHVQPDSFEVHSHKGELKVEEIEPDR